MVLEKNVFVDRVLHGSIMRPLTTAEMAEYRPLRNAGEPAPHPDLAARNPDRGRAGRRGGTGPGLRRLAGRQRSAQAVRECRTGLHPDGAAARILSQLAEPVRSDRAWHALHSGRQPRCDRRGARPLHPRTARG
jgi:hypothetical protein